VFQHIATVYGNPLQSTTIYCLFWSTLRDEHRREDHWIQWQYDLPSLHHAHAEVLTYLLQDRNREYYLAARGGKRLLEKGLLQPLGRRNIRVLTGAYILEMGNEAWRLRNLPSSAIRGNPPQPATIRCNRRTAGSRQHL